MPFRDVLDPLMQIDFAGFPAQLDPANKRGDVKPLAAQGIDDRDALFGSLLRPRRAGHFGRNAPRKFRWISVDA